MRRLGGVTRGWALSGFVLLALLGALFPLSGCGDDEGSDESTEAFEIEVSTPTGTGTAPPASADGQPASGSDGEATTPSAEPPLLPGQKQPARPVGTVRGKGPQADVRAVVRAVRTYLQAIGGGNGELACAQLTDQAQAKIRAAVGDVVPEQQGSGCATAILLYQGAFGGGLENPRVTGVRVSGTTATANGPAKTRATLTKAGRTWLISDYSEPGGG